MHTVRVIAHLCSLLHSQYQERTENAHIILLYPPTNQHPTQKPGFTEQRTLAISKTVIFSDFFIVE